MEPITIYTEQELRVGEVVAAGLWMLVGSTLAILAAWSLGTVPVI